MKTKVLMGMLAVAMVLMPFAGFAADEPKEMTLTGEPVDINCYLTGKSGEGHAACATACAAKGNPIGLVVTEGDKSTLYLVIGAGGKQANDVLGSHMGKQVSVKGKVTKKEGLSVIEVAEVSAS